MSTSQSLARAKALIKSRYNLQICDSGNRELINSISMIILSKKLTPDASTPILQVARQIDWLEKIAKLLMTLTRPVKISDFKGLEDSLDRPPEFDIDSMLLKRDIVALAETIRLEPQISTLMNFASLPGFDVETARKFWDDGCESIPSLLEYISESDLSEDLKEDLTLAITASTETPIRRSIRSTEISQWNLYARYELEKREGKLGGVVQVMNLGDIARGRQATACHSVVFFKSEWSKPEVDKVKEVLCKKSLVKAVLFEDTPNSLNAESENESVSLLEGHFYIAKVHAISPTTGELFHQTQVFATLSSFATVSLLLQSPPEYAIALQTIATSRGYSLLPRGLFPLSSTTSSRSAANEGKKLEAIPFRNETKLCDFLRISIYPVTDRHTSIGEDLLPWAGLTEADIEAEEQQEQEAKKQKKTKTSKLRQVGGSKKKKIQATSRKKLADDGAAEEGQRGVKRGKGVDSDGGQVTKRRGTRTRKAGVTYQEDTDTD